ncbi:glycoside hydrolase family 13 protein [Lacticaseibacillus parakribbianus]|uniref:glycoside hydrolase family 13 protein n=1 Tax=Lacticaseibacillus parakribbianus TaxID=2970927 RepID=UPI0021CAF2D2|nr:alpha-glucosidase [Lacticaseibacillus parakribbianus]
MTTWSDQAIIYQIYPKSFQDSNGDGVGDLNGIRLRIPYLKALGVTAVWLNPIFTSPQVDNGYDVANYYAVDPQMGTMADLEALVAALHAAGLRVILDFVMNHTSDQHPWFQDAIHSADSLYRDYYIFAGQNNRRPNNWGSFFGGSVWAEDPAGSGQSYFHLFDRRMPDLNWANPEVRHAMQDVADFWLAKGIDGLRLDAFIHIAKAPLEQDWPTAAGDDEPVIAEPFFANRPQVQDWLQPFCQHIKADYPDALLLGEAASASVDLAAAYTAKSSQLMDSVVTFRYFTDRPVSNPQLPAAYQPREMDWLAFKRVQATWQQTLVAPPTLYWSNHDMARLATRVAHDPIQARSLAMLMYLQRGIPIIYYGEELGMQNLQLPDPAAFADATVTAFVAQVEAAGGTTEEALAWVNRTHKLPARGPMPWGDAGIAGAEAADADGAAAAIGATAQSTAPVAAGFTTGTPWLTGRAAAGATAAEQDQDPTSLLFFYHDLIALKKQPLFATGNYQLLSTADTIYAYRRTLADRQALVAVNLSAAPAVLQLPLAGMARQLTAGVVTRHGDTLKLGPHAGVVLTTR